MLKLSDACAGYAQEILHEVNISLKAGELVSLIGENGCGKTTLLRTLIRTLPLNRGTLSVDELSDLPPCDYARRVAYLPQSRPTPQISVYSLIAHGRFPHLSFPRKLREVDRAKIEAAISALNLSAYRDRKLCELSGGERQRVYLAMLLSQDAKYLLLDEPTTYLDVRHQFEALSYLRKLAQDGRGILMTVHDIAAALNHSDRVLVMKRGTIVADDTPEHICKSDILQKTFGVHATKISTEHGLQYIISPV